MPRCFDLASPKLNCSFEIPAKVHVCPIQTVLMINDKSTAKGPYLIDDRKSGKADKALMGYGLSLSTVHSSSFPAQIIALATNEDIIQGKQILTVTDFQVQSANLHGSITYEREAVIKGDKHLPSFVIYKARFEIKDLLGYVNKATREDEPPHKIIRSMPITLNNSEKKRKKVEKQPAADLKQGTSKDFILEEYSCLGSHLHQTQDIKVHNLLIPFLIPFATISYLPRHQYNGKITFYKLRETEQDLNAAARLEWSDLGIFVRETTDEKTLMDIMMTATFLNNVKAFLAHHIKTRAEEIGEKDHLVLPNFLLFLTPPKILLPERVLALGNSVYRLDSECNGLPYKNSLVYAYEFEAVISERNKLAEFLIATSHALDHYLHQAILIALVPKDLLQYSLSHVYFCPLEYQLLKNDQIALAEKIREMLKHSGKGAEIIDYIWKSKFAQNLRNNAYAIPKSCKITSFPWTDVTVLPHENTSRITHPKLDLFHNKKDEIIMPQEFSRIHRHLLLIHNEKAFGEEFNVKLAFSNSPSSHYKRVWYKLRSNLGLIKLPGIFLYQQTATIIFQPHKKATDGKEFEMNIE